MMKKILALLLVVVSFLSASAQKITADQVKFTDGTFSKVVEMPGKTAREIYNIAFIEGVGNGNDLGCFLLSGVSANFDSNWMSASICFEAKNGKYRIMVYRIGCSFNNMDKEVSFNTFKTKCPKVYNDFKKKVADTFNDIINKINSYKDF